MASIDNINGKFRARVRFKGITRTKTFLRHADAKAWAIKMESLINDGLQGNAGRNVLFSDLLTKYIAEIVPGKRGAREETYRLNRILAAPLAKLIVDEIQPSDFANWRDNRLTEVSPASVRRELETLSSVCNVAVKEWGIMRENPVLKISRPKPTKSRSRRPTAEEIEKILFALHYSEDCSFSMVSQRVAAATLFAIETGMRSGEMLNLTWPDINFEQRTAYLDMTKNGSSRTVPLSKRAVKILQKLRKINETSVFAVESSTRDTLFRKAVTSQGIEDLHFHDLRREALTRMAKKVDVMTLAKISGHKDIRVLMNTYYAPSMSAIADLLD